MDVLKPQYLRSGATIGIIAPASPQRDDLRLERGVRYLERLGFRVELGKNVHGKYGGYLAGTDAERCADIEGMFANKDISAIICSRGGYGTPRILNSLNYRTIAKNPKIFVGFSDVTALQSAVFLRTGLITFSGAMVSADMADVFDEESESQFWQILTEPIENRLITQSITLESLQNGIAQGRLLCGNLSMMVGLLGTPFAPEWENSIVLLEDIGEAPYRIDRNLMHLENAGVWNKLNGLCFGQFTQTDSTPVSVPQRDVTDVLAEYAARAALPSLGNVMYGHTAKKLTLPFGSLVQIDSENCKIKITESVVV